MARFIPDVRSEEIAHDSERLVYEALRSLPDAYVVAHSFPWLRPNRNFANEPLREGEADFIILHPAKGVLVLEVKGGAPELRERTWFRGGRELRDPFDQARRNRYALLQAVEDRTSGKVHRHLFAHGDVVVFPHCRYAGPLPLNAEPRVIIDATGLTTIEQRLEGAFDAWRCDQAPLAPAVFTRLLDALLPKLRLIRCGIAGLALEKERLVQVTQDQQATLRGLVENERVFVQGSAGSGKTLLAMEFAATLASQGRSVLFLCFNRDLAVWLNEQLERDPGLQGADGRVEIWTFHAYAMRLAGRAKIEFSIPQERSEEFWDDEVPMILEQALDVLRREARAPLYDAVLVDEAQDFSPDWWVTVESLTKNGRTGRLYAFADLHQSLRGHPTVPAVPLTTKFQLKTNCRNTKAIARSSSRLAGAEVTLLPSVPEGDPPSLRRAPSASAGAGLVLDEVRRLLRDGLSPRDLVLIGPSPRLNGSLAKFTRVEDVPLVDDPSDWRRGAGVLVTTARSFKGLEADVVIAYDLGSFGPYFTPTDLYVAWTRARHRLICVAHGADARARIEAALAEAEQAQRQAQLPTDGPQKE